jgi:poly-beta-1,6-N-acetyl-D-glucosamine synthase
MLYVAYIVLALSAVNLFRMALFLLASDIFDIKETLRKPAEKASLTSGMVNSRNGITTLQPRFLVKTAKSQNPSKHEYKPLVTVIVPAHNEEKTLGRNLQSIAASSYKNVEVIIVNDSSTDRKHKDEFKRITVINVKVRGKAKALNAGLKIAKGKLFMCLDADSALTEKALEYGVAQFRDRRVAALCSNVKILPGRGFLNFFQRLEYLVCYQMKKAESLTNTQYIVGGIGSMFRTKLVQGLGQYDTDTLTEDIDLSMKIIAKFGNKSKIAYDPRMVVFTEAVHDIRGLMQQRYRWKYGRYQVFLKQRSLFWSRSKKQNRLLTWLYLPYALYAELAYSLEPLTFLVVLYILVAFHSAAMILCSFLVFSLYTTIQITGATASYSLKERLMFVGLSPLAFIGMYSLAFVEYMATVRGLLNIKKLIKNYRKGEGDCEWTHVERKGTASVA